MYGSLLRRVLYPLYETGLRRRGTLRYLAEYERTQWLSAEQIREIQIQKLRLLLRHCQQHVPYWTERFAEMGADWHDFRTLTDFARIPPIGKDEIRQNYDRLIATDHRGRTMRKTTGGSTGEPFAFEYTRESYERRTAVSLRGYRWAGADIGIRRLDLWGVDLQTPANQVAGIKARAYNAVVSRKVLSAFALSDTTLQDYAHAFEAYRPAVLVGYTSALVAFAEWILADKPLAWRPRAVISAAEMLTADHRGRIEAAFHAPVFNTYGSREFMLIGAECDAHQGLHLSDDHLIVEVVNDAGQLVQQGSGHIAITDLHNYGMPFVRYLIGDIGTIDPARGTCRCGRGLSTMAAVEGRRLDMLYSPDGRMLPGEFFPHLLKDYPQIARFQVRQQRLDQIRVLIKTREEEGGPWLEALQSDIARHLGGRVWISVELVDDIAATASGKHRVTVNEMTA